jgi:hypothetical protein
MESLERFAEVMSDEEPEPQTLSPYALDRTTGFYVKVRNVMRCRHPAGRVHTPCGINVLDRSHQSMGKALVYCDH